VLYVYLHLILLYVRVFVCLFSFFLLSLYFLFFFFTDTSTTEIYTLSLHDALPILPLTTSVPLLNVVVATQLSLSTAATVHCTERSEEHTSELQSRSDLVCRLLLEKKKKHKLQYSTVTYNEYVRVDSPIASLQTRIT